MIRPPGSATASGAAFEAWVAEGRAAWPDIDVPADELRRFAERHAETPARGALHAADVYLACACLCRVPRAIEAFDRLLVSSVARGAARVDPSKAFADGVAQELRARLLMGDPPKLSDYAGRAPLARWLKTAAVRTALNARRAKADQRHEAIRSDLIVSKGRPDLELLRARYKEHFEAALRVALHALGTRDRALLCLTLRDGVSMDKLAGIYGVGRSTIVRWLSAARETLARETRREISARVGLTADELDSIGALLRSDLDVSVVRLLQQT